MRYAADIVCLFVCLFVCFCHKKYPNLEEEEEEAKFNVVGF
jgi:hypothetical protein